MNELSWYYVVTAKGIQDFILQGDKIRFMVGASELIEQLPNKFLDDCLKKIEIDQGDYKIISRAAGSARILFKNESHAKKLFKIMPLLVNIYAPGLNVIQHIQKIEGNLPDTIKKSEVSIQQKRNKLYIDYPIAGPLVDRAPRSGRPIYGDIRLGGDSEPADISMLKKDKEYRRLKKDSSENKYYDEKMSDFKKLIYSNEIPESIERLADSKNSYIAILHADANGLGKIVMNLMNKLKDISNIEEAADKYRRFSELISKATEESAFKALKDIKLENHLNFIPLICAGDDFTIILKAKDAISVASKFLQEFEENCKIYLKEFLGEEGISAAAGIVFINKKFPFYQAYGLCESLCKYSKEKTERKYSALSFWRVTTSTAEEFDNIIDRELTPQENVELTMMPYTVSAKNVNHPNIESLKELAKCMKKMPHGSMRNMLSEIFISKENMEESFKRMLEVHNGNEKLKDLINGLENVTGNSGEEALFKLYKDKDKDRYYTPLHDAVELLSVNTEFSSNGGNNE